MRVAPRCKWASEYPEYALTTTCLAGYLPACARNRFVFLRAPQRPSRGSLFASFSLYTYHALVFHRRRTLLKFRFSRLRPTLPPLPLQFASKAPFSLLSLSSFCPSLSLHIVIIRHLLFYLDLYTPFYKERKENKWICWYRLLNSWLFDAWVIWSWRINEQNIFFKHLAHSTVIIRKIFQRVANFT